MKRVSVQRRPGRDRCPYCYDLADEGGECVTCPGCETRVHEECARELRRCPTLGCHERLLGLARREAGAPPGEAPRVCSRCGDAAANPRDVIRCQACGAGHTALCLEADAWCQMCGQRVDPPRRAEGPALRAVYFLLGALLVLFPFLIKGWSVAPPTRPPLAPWVEVRAPAPDQHVRYTPSGPEASWVEVPPGTPLRIRVPAGVEGCVVTAVGPGAQLAPDLPRSAYSAHTTPEGVGVWLPGQGERVITVRGDGPVHVVVQVDGLEQAWARLSPDGLPLPSHTAAHRDLTWGLAPLP